MRRLWLALRRLRAWRRSSDPVYKAFVERPLPQRGTRFEDAELVCLDIETTGLDPESADMLSIGWVLIRGGKVDLATAESLIVRPLGDVGHTASVHGLTDTIVGQGVAPTEAMYRVIAALTGRVLVVHYAGLDKNLLDRLCRAQFGDKLLVPVIDTLALEHRRTSRHHHLDDTRSLRLPDLRAHYNLPRYGGHDCLMDAVATAELLLAMVASRAPDCQTLGDLY
ncbi:MAG: 3'-5' exonuclease [Woeseiaceae bacterium]|nr:3'-5' exonuclease [Woeseiaceae bacterium]TFG41806.1 MAG: 3'-5' exonuclease [Chromatiales bacterium]